MSIANPGTWRWDPEFVPEEMASPPEHNDGRTVHGMDERFMDRLLWLRRQWAKPMIINSAFRTPEHNAAIGGKSGSYHLKGRAVDVGMLDASERWEFLRLVYECRCFRGVGVYDSFVHLDDRDRVPPAVWVR